MNYDTEAQQILTLIELYKIQTPKNWDSYTNKSKLEYIGDRILAQARTTKSHKEMKEQGYLSTSQRIRRYKREVYSNHEGGLDELAPKQGVFSRPISGPKRRETKDRG